MILASAQTRPKNGNINVNLSDHYRLITIAAQHGARLIVFPEMSITGYEHEKALGMTFTENDSRLSELRRMAVEKQIVIIAGAPILIKKNLYIGSFILKPDNSILIYTKQFLYTGEDKIFTSSLDYNPLIEIDTERISFAICADVDNPLHAENASRVGTSIYIASLFFSPNGIPDAYKRFSEYAVKYGMNVLISNFCGQSWVGSEAGGQSGFWDKKGLLIANLNKDDAGLLLVKKVNGGWTGNTIKYE